MGVVIDINVSIVKDGNIPLGHLFVGHISYDKAEVYADLYDRDDRFIRVRLLTESEISELSNKVTLRNIHNKGI